MLFGLICAAGCKERLFRELLQISIDFLCFAARCHLGGNITPFSQGESAHIDGSNLQI